MCFNPPGGFGAFGTSTPATPFQTTLRFQSAGRIWGFRNTPRRGSRSPSGRRFNPPGGFGAFGTLTQADPLIHDGVFQSAGRIWGFRNAGLTQEHHVACWFQSAGRIWGFRNWWGIRPAPRRRKVSIRRADLGLSEPSIAQSRATTGPCFNPPGGFGAFGTQRALKGQADELARFNPPGGFGAFGTAPSSPRLGRGPTVSIRRADLGLSEHAQRPHRPNQQSQFQSAGRIWGFRNVWCRSAHRGGLPVSIRRADLGLSEPRMTRPAHRPSILCFNPPGGFGAFGTVEPSPASTSRLMCFNPPGGFGAFGTRCRSTLLFSALIVSIRRADLGLSEPRWQWRRRCTWWGSFNPPGGFGAFGTRAHPARQPS